MTSKFKYSPLRHSLATLALTWLVLVSLGFELYVDVYTTDLGKKKIELTNFADNIDDSEIDELDVDWINDSRSCSEISAITYRHPWVQINLLKDIIFEPIPAPPPERG